MPPQALYAILRGVQGWDRLRMPGRPVRLPQARFWRSGRYLRSHPSLPFAGVAAGVACRDGSTTVGAGADRGLLGHAVCLSTIPRIMTAGSSALARAAVIASYSSGSNQAACNVTASTITRSTPARIAAAL